MRKHVLLYGLLGGVFIAVLQVIEYRWPAVGRAVAATGHGTDTGDTEHRSGGTVTFASLLKKPSAFTPLAMSVLALILIAVVVATATPEPGPHDERAPARLFQLLMLLQIPVSAVFAGRWLPRAPRPALLVLFLQAGAALLTIATIVWLES